MKHTNTPWIIADLGTSGPTRTVRESKAGGRRVAECQTDELGYYDAAFIVRACNAHDDLVSILGRILAAHDSGNNGSCMGEAVLCTMFADLARDALAKAKGGA